MTLPTLLIDQMITRRKVWHILNDADDNYLTGSRYLGDVLDYIAKHDILVYRILDGQNLYEVTMHRVRETKGA